MRPQLRATQYVLESVTHDPGRDGLASPTAPPHAATRPTAKPRYPKFETEGSVIRPRPTLRIVPGRVSGEPHLAGSRITTLSAAALYESLGYYTAVAELYPGFTANAFRDAVEFESSLAA